MLAYLLELGRSQTGYPEKVLRREKSKLGPLVFLEGFGDYIYIIYFKSVLSRKASSCFFCSSEGSNAKPEGLKIEVKAVMGQVDAHLKLPY